MEAQIFSLIQLRPKLVLGQRQFMFSLKKNQLHGLLKKKIEGKKKIYMIGPLIFHGFINFELCVDFYEVVRHNILAKS